MTVVRTLVGMILLLFTTIPFAAQKGLTSEVISPANITNLSLLGTLVSLEENSIRRVEWLSDAGGSLVVYSTSDDEGIWIYDVNDPGSAPRHLIGRGNLSSNGRYWAVRDPNQSSPLTRLFDTRDGTLLQTFQHGQVILTDNFDAVAFNPDTTRIASAWHDTITIWDISTGNIISTISGESMVTSLSFNLDGSLIAAGLYDASVGVWDSNSGEMVMKIRDHINVVYPRFVSMKNWLLITSIDRTVTLWDLNSEERLLFVPAHTDLVYALFAASSENVIVADATVQKGIKHSVMEIWDAAQAKQIASVELVDHDDIGYLIPGHITFDSEAQSALFWTTNTEALLVDIESGQNLQSLVHRGVVQGAVFSPDSRLVASWDDELYLWDVETGEMLTRIDGSPIQDAIFSLDGSRLILVYADGSIQMWGIAE
jgi:WD40 repeat protein